MSDRDILIDPSPAVGSTALAAALANRDVSAIGDALRTDVVVVPQYVTPEGEEQVRVFGSETSDRPYRLYLFSSATTFQAFLPADDPLRSFTIVRGRSLAGFLEQHLTQLDLVVFDGAGPHTMTADPADVLAALLDDSAEVGEPDVAEFPGDGDASAVRTLALDLGLPDEWAVIDLESIDRRDEQIREVVSRQLAGVPAGAPLRPELEKWLRRAAQNAAGAGGRFMAFLLRRSAAAAAALNLTMYWNTLGPVPEGPSHLDALSARLRSELSGDDQLLGADTQGGPLVRHTHVVAGAADLDAQNLPVLVIDYWLQFPDGRGLALLSFSTPHLDGLEMWHRLTDAIVLGSRWLVDAEPADDSAQNA